MDDTSPEARAVLIRLARDLSPGTKILQVARLTEIARELSMVGLRRRYPDASPEELRLRLAALVLDAETVGQVYGWDPRQEGC